MSHADIRDIARENLLEYTRAAFRMLPPVDKPSILDIGCGSGVQTIELARMCNGNITAIDIDKVALEVLRRKVESLGFSSRISVIELSMSELGRFRKVFDIIWAEGSIFAVGFEIGIREWKKLLPDKGYLVVHDDDTQIATKLQIIAKYGYEILGQIDIPHETWWSRYYGPIEDLLIQGKFDDDRVDEIKKEISNFKRTKMGSVFFILKKKF